MPVTISCSNQSRLFSPSLLLLFKPKTVQNVVPYYLSIFPRLSAAIIGLTVNKTLGYNVYIFIYIYYNFCQFKNDFKVKISIPSSDPSSNI